jgi:hypothetical protein
MEGFEGQNLAVNVSFWTGPRLLINGEPAPKGTKRGEMLLRRNDGTPVIARWKPQVLGLDVPQLVADGKTVPLVEPLTWYQLLWGGWPVLLIFMGGFLGAVAGMTAFLINTRLFRAGMNGLLKYIVTGLVSVLAVIAYLVMGLLFAILVGG